MKDLKVALQLKSVLSCTIEKSILSAVCHICTGDINKESSHSKIKYIINPLIMQLICCLQTITFEPETQES